MTDTFVVAGSYQQYRSCLQEYNLDWKTTKYVTNPHDIRGIAHKSMIVYFYGDYLQNRIMKDWHSRYWLIDVISKERIYQEDSFYR